MNASDVRLVIQRARGDLLQRYDVSKTAMRGAFLSTLMQASRPQAMYQEQLDRELGAIVSAAIKTEREIARIAVAGLLREIDSSLEVEDVIDKVNEFTKSVVRQIRKDAKDVSELFRLTQLRKQTSGESVEIVLLRAIQDVTRQKFFTYIDVKRRLWESSRYLSTLSASFYYSLANDLIVSKMVAQGKNTGVLDRPGHESNGRAIKLSEYDAVRPLYFHPGSQAILLD